MKGKITTYWIATVLLSCLQSLAAFLYLTHYEPVMKAFAQLGYPSYFPNILGVAKASGVLALLWPGMGLIKEWAYAGFAITFVSGFVSHLASGSGVTLPPLAALALLAVSWFTRPPERRAGEKIG